MRSARSLSPIPNWPIVNTNVCVAKLRRCSLYNNNTLSEGERGGAGISRGCVNSEGVHQGEIYGVIKGKISRVSGQVVCRDGKSAVGLFGKRTCSVSWLRCL